MSRSSRRRFLRTAAGSLAVASGGLAGCAALPNRLGRSDAPVETHRINSVNLHPAAHTVRVRVEPREPRFVGSDSWGEPLLDSEVTLNALTDEREYDNEMLEYRGRTGRKYRVRARFSDGDWTSLQFTEDDPMPDVVVWVTNNGELTFMLSH